MVILPYIGTMGKLKFHFSLSVSTQFDLYQHSSREQKKSRKVCKPGVILKISQSYHVLLLLLFLPVEEQYLINRNTNKQENLPAYILFFLV